MAPVVTVTLNPTIDKHCSIDRVVPERKLRCSEPVYKAGGGGLNVARVVQRLGRPALALWTRGRPMGVMLSEILDGEEMEHRPIFMRSSRLSSPGAILTTAEESEHIAALVVPIHSKLGAGDSMVAGIAYALSEGRSVREAVQLGIATGAAVVMTGGTDVCRRSDVEQILAS